MPTKPAVPPIHITPPIFGVAYNVGWIGFTRCSGLVSDAISYGERRERGEFPEVTHVLIAIGDSQCIEAHAGSGVSYAKLSKYLDDPATHVYFRQPIGWTPKPKSTAFLSNNRMLNLNKKEQAPKKLSSRGLRNN